MPHPAPAEIPESFWRDLPAEPPRSGSADGSRYTTTALPPKPQGSWQPTKMMYWYDSIIDDMLANPGTSLQETARRLGRNQVTISLIARSDLFKSRYAQRRDHFNADLDQRLTGKVAKVAEAALDLTLQVLEAKRTSVPLPQLVDIQNKALDRLGYGTSANGGSAPLQVNIQNNQAVAVPVAVSAAGLEEARRMLRLVEGKKLEGGIVEALPSSEAWDRGEG